MIKESLGGKLRETKAKKKQRKKKKGEKAQKF